MNDSEAQLKLPGKKSKPFNPVVFAFNRVGFILIGGLFVFLLGLPFALKKASPYFQTGGVLIISPEVKQFLRQDEDTISGSFKDYVSTQVHRLKTEDVLVDALKRVNLENWPNFIDPEKELAVAAKKLKERLIVNHVSRSYLIYVGLSDGSSDGLDEVINAVIDSYIRKLQVEQEDQSERRIEYIQKERENVNRKMSEIRSEIQKVGSELESNSFNDNQNLLYEYVVELQKDYLEAYTESLRERNNLEFVKSERDRFDPDKVEIFAQESVSRNEAIYLVKNWTYQQLQELRASIDGLTSDNADRLYVETRMQAMDEYLDTFEEDLFNSFLTVMQQRSFFELDESVFKAMGSYKSMQDLVRELKSELIQGRKEYEESSRLIAEGKMLRSRMNELSSRKLYLDNLMAEVFLEAKTPLRIGVEEYAKTPLAPTGDNRMKLLLMLLVVAFGIPTAVFGVFDFLDDRIRRKSDLVAALGDMTIEVIPHQTEIERAGINLRYDEAARKQFSNFALRMEQDHSQNESCIFLLAGAERHPVQYAYCHQIAHALTRYSEQVVVISFGNRPGFNVEHRKVQHMVFSDIGSRRDLLEDIHLLKETYDFVIIDGGGLLDDDLTRYLIPEVDVNVLMVWERLTLFKDVRESLRLLHSLKAKALTTVLGAAIPDELDEVIDYRNQLFHYISAIHRTILELLTRPFPILNRFLVKPL